MCRAMLQRWPNRRWRCDTSTSCCRWTVRHSRSPRCRPLGPSRSCSQRSWSHRDNTRPIRPRPRSSRSHRSRDRPPIHGRPSSCPYRARDRRPREACATMFGELRSVMVSNHSTWPHAARVAPQAGERRPNTIARSVPPRAARALAVAHQSSEPSTEIGEVFVESWVGVQPERGRQCPTCRRRDRAAQTQSFGHPGHWGLRSDTAVRRRPRPRRRPDRRRSCTRRRRPIGSRRCSRRRARSARPPSQSRGHKTPPLTPSDAQGHHHRSVRPNWCRSGRSGVHERAAGG